MPSNKSGLTREALVAWLYAISCVYLGLPYVIFLWGWFRQPYALILVAVLLAGLAAAVARPLRQLSPPISARHLSWASLATVAFSVLPIAMIAGAGGWGVQDTDWLKHNAVLRDLVEYSWPPVYEVNGTRAMLTYYTAYLLPAAAVGKWLGWQAANHVLFLYTFVGLALAALWVWSLTGAKHWWTVVVFLGFSGMDILGLAVAKIYLTGSLLDAAGEFAAAVTAFDHIEWWAGWGFASLSSTQTLLMWVPNQGISGWLLTAMLISDAQSRSLRTTWLLILGLSTLWAPFVSLGLFPIALIVVLGERARHGWGGLFRGALSPANASGLTVAVFVLLYLSARFEPFVMPVEAAGVYQERITLTFLRLAGDPFWSRYALFVALEFGLLHILVFQYLRMRSIEPFSSLSVLLPVSATLLCLLPILNWGFNNEPAMRSSIPALFITMLAAIGVLSDPPRIPLQRWLKRGLVAALLLGSATAAVEIGRHVAGAYNRGALVQTPPTGQIQTLFELQETRYQDYYFFTAQYLGSADSTFSRHLGRSSAVEPATRVSDR